MWAEAQAELLLLRQRGELSGEQKTFCSAE
jgi:hypothetical protein